jgi:hypothetical protein
MAHFFMFSYHILAQYLAFPFPPLLPIPPGSPVGFTAEGAQHAEKSIRETAPTVACV